METRQIMSWLTIKTFLKKCWVWLKHNWKAPLIVVYTIVLWVFFRRKDDAMKVLETRTESYKKQIDAINDIHERETKKKDKILENYGKILTDLEKKYKEDNLELDKEEKKEIKNLVEKYDEKPAELAKLLAEKYGLEYVE
jgi:adenylate kinase family enzyme